jgi:hypothetical protein
MPIRDVSEWRQSHQLQMNEKITIWRYLSLEKWLSMLTTKQMVFSNLASFSDKNEVEYLLQILTENNDTKLDDSLKDHINHLKNDYYAVCWNAKEGECRSLWYAYTGDARIGVAIKSTVQSFFSSVDCLDNIPNCFKVAYGPLTNDPAYLQINELPLFCKSPAYESENEIRFLLNNIGARLDFSDVEKRQPMKRTDPKLQPPTIQFNCDLSQLIEGFMISPFADEWQKTAILETTKVLAPELKDKCLSSSIIER